MNGEKTKTNGNFLVTNQKQGWRNKYKSLPSEKFSLQSVWERIELTGLYTFLLSFTLP